MTIFKHILVWSLIALMSSCFGIVVFWAFQNYINPGVDLINPHVVGETRVKAGDIVSVEYTIIRRRTCTLQISRIIQTMNGRYKGREAQLQFVEISFKGDDKPRTIGYTVEVPPNLPEDPNEQEIDYDIFARVRYFCNGLDRIWPRYMTHDGKLDTGRVRITVTR